MNITFQGKGDFNKAEAWLNDIVNRQPTQALKKIASEGEKNLSNNTPKDTGQTAAGWKSQITTKGHVTEVAWTNRAHPNLSVNIAKLIDQGHGTGTGGYVAPKPYIKRSMDSVWKSASEDIAKELIE